MDYFFEFVFIVLFIYALVATFLLAKRKPKPKSSVKPGVAIVDTSVLIDGRIEGIAKTGFISGKLVVPKFVIEELQKVSDSANALKRNRGRRGIEILRDLQKVQHFKLEITDAQYPDQEDVDQKIIEMAKDMGANILTVDYNLNRIAEVQGVFTLNINELANSLKPAVLPGEIIEVKVVQKGKERNQGVGYLDDGTMVVVEEGLRFMRRQIKGVVSRIFQTDAGRMIFVKLQGREVDTRKERGGFIQSSRRFIPRFPRFGFRKKGRNNYYQDRDNRRR